MNLSSKRSHSDLVYNVVSRLSLAEFIQYTNITKLIQNVLSTKNFSSTGQSQPNLIFKYVETIHTDNIQNEQDWSNGYFQKLGLTENFYSTSTAENIFASTYGLKMCNVSVKRIDSEKIFALIYGLKVCNVSVKRLDFDESNHLDDEKLQFDQDDDSYSDTSSMENLRASPCGSIESDEPNSPVKVQLTRNLFQISLERAKELFEEYIKETAPSELSLTSFWNHYFKFEFEEDI